VDSTARAVAAVSARPLLRASCLEQGLALTMWLAAAHIPARVVLGVRRSQSLRSGLSAHAWVEHDGRIVLGAVQAVGLTPLPELCRG
jgi:hypothetical protein